MRKDKKKYEILVIEDNPGDFILIEDYLREQVVSPQITHVQKFSEAKSLLNSYKTNYDVILLDLSLPDKSGETLITEIKSLCSGCPVIVLTGYEDIEFSIKSLSLGVADYLVKDDINASSLYKSIIYNIERKKTNIKLEESEKRYSNLFHLSPQPMWVYEPETLRFVQVNKAAMEHYGYSEEEFFNMTIMDIMLEEDVMKVKESLKKDKKKETNFDGRFRHYRKSKETIEVEIFSNPIMINDKVYCSVIAIDVTEKVLFEHNLTRAIIKTQEDERYEIGGELHDNICQILATSQMNLEMMKESLVPSVVQRFDQCKKYMILAAEEIRNLSHRLAPAFFDDTTLHDTFMTLLNTFNVGNRYKISLHFDAAVQEYPLNRDILLNLYRILQEQLRNISKYANATKLKVKVLIHNNNKLEMRVSDNGVGFDIKKIKGGIGLANIKRRAELFSGTIEIDSSPGNGCKIAIKIPLQTINADSLFEPLYEMANL
jgi:PAS domain S-box-containing protein